MDLNFLDEVGLARLWTHILMAIENKMAQTSIEWGSWDSDNDTPLEEGIPEN